MTSAETTMRVGLPLKCPNCGAEILAVHEHPAPIEADTADEIERLRAREALMVRAIHIWVSELSGHLHKLGDILKEPPTYD